MTGLLLAPDSMTTAVATSATSLVTPSPKTLSPSHSSTSGGGGTGEGERGGGTGGVGDSTIIVAIVSSVFDVTMIMIFTMIVMAFIIWRKSTDHAEHRELQQNVCHTSSSIHEMDNQPK